MFHRSLLESRFMKCIIGIWMRSEQRKMVAGARVALALFAWDYETHKGTDPNSPANCSKWSLRQDLNLRRTAYETVLEPPPVHAAKKMLSLFQQNHRWKSPSLENSFK